ncbi:MAG: glycosyltransferase family 39 protein [Proteobacteria bacterium]|nr:hypothetical protein [Desulfobacteraceae bacterium]MBU3979735.1 glycosyltransferase family 39 protein [Pseudomonadota bacterium]MBU4068678.1 glycosyltransferase family 39 protein [Pseudomonadota bacterium]MBU4101366.1 glycosyltransferase family 39 protein [Pseudomonadota bacterium]MBU4209771.1 glycosyltransferase family 39 protein [Pseudomonadota bacterium]
MEKQMSYKSRATANYRILFCNTELVVLFLFLIIVLTCLSSSFGLTWDEAYYFDYADAIKQWWTNGADISKSAIIKYWGFDSYHNPHPPFMKIMAAITSELFSNIGAYPLPYRMANIIYVSINILIIFIAVKQVYSKRLAYLSIIFILFQPRILGHSLIGATDSAIAFSALSFTLSSYMAVRYPEKRTLWWIVAGLIFATGVSTKFTGLLIILPVTAWVLYNREFRAFAVLAGIILFSFLFLIIIYPLFWHNPITGLYDYLVHPFTRKDLFPFLIYYFGKNYFFDVPWHYFDVMSLITIPPVILFFLPGLLIKKVCNKDLTLLLLFIVLFWLIIGHLPFTPKHDVIRQFLPFYPIIAMLSAIGLDNLLSLFQKRFDQNFLVRKYSYLPMLLIIFFYIFSNVSHHPFELSYYNMFIGGVKGAEKKGMELSYWMESLTPDFICLLNDMLPRNTSLTLLPNNSHLHHLQKRGILRNDIRINDKLDSNSYFILVRRRSAINDKIFNLKEIANVSYDKVILLKLLEIK